MASELCEDLLEYSREVKEDTCEREFDSQRTQVSGGERVEDSDTAFACKVGVAGMSDKIQEEHCLD